MEHTVTALELNILKKKIKEFIDSKNLTRNIHRTQANGSIMCSCFFSGFIHFM